MARIRASPRSSPRWLGGRAHGPLGRLGAGDPIKIDWHELTEQSARLDVTACAYARFYRDELGAPELGHLLVCENDDWFVEGLGDVEFERHHTIMQGAERCDFCYRLAAPPSTGTDFDSASSPPSSP